jgi:hypothetical protein
LDYWEIRRQKINNDKKFIKKYWDTDLNDYKYIRKYENKIIKESYYYKNDLVCYSEWVYDRSKRKSNKQAWRKVADFEDSHPQFIYAKLIKEAVKKYKDTLAYDFEPIDISNIVNDVKEKLVNGWVSMFPWNI